MRARTATEKAFLALGPVAEAFLRAAAAAGQSRLPAHLGDIAALEPAHGRDVLIAAPGAPLDTGLPQAPGRSLNAYAPDQLGASGQVAR